MRKTQDGLYCESDMYLIEVCKIQITIQANLSLKSFINKFISIASTPAALLKDLCVTSSCDRTVKVWDWRSKTPKLHVDLRKQGRGTGNLKKQGMNKK